MQPVASPLTVIIPTLNEANQIGQTLASLEQAQDAEIVVVDGGSWDETLEVARQYPCRIINAPRGRASQLNAGASAASGDVLLFLHADTRLPDGFLDIVQSTLEQDRVVAGAFSLSIDGAGVMLRLIERCVNLRSRWLQLPYGDQALFLTRRIFDQAGRFPEVPIMEDFLLVRRLRKLGLIRTVSSRVSTSARRWLEQGTLRTTMINQAIIAGYHLAIPPERLARWYRRRR